MTLYHPLCFFYHRNLMSILPCALPLLDCCLLADVTRTLTRTSFYAASSHQSLLIKLMAGWILCSKMIKIAPHFFDHPSDLAWLPTYIAFAYWHSFVKLYCGLTFWDHSWNGRNLKLTQVASVQDLEKEELKSIVPDRPHILRGTTGLYPPETSYPYRRISTVKEG